MQYPYQHLINALDYDTQCNVKNAEYFFTDLCLADDESEALEIIAYYVSRYGELGVPVAEFYDLGYRVVPDGVEILEVYEQDEYDGTYKRSWKKCRIVYDSVEFDAIIEWHLHDGCTTYCVDQCWIYVTQGV